MGTLRKIRRRGLYSQIHVVADGAEWIRLQSREVFSDQEHFLCDFDHVSQYLADASKSCRAQSPERWRKTQQKRLKNGAATKVIQELAQHIEPPGTPEVEAPVFCAYRYMNNRGDAFDYPRALKHQLPIGSGLIESGHRHVLQARLKAAGTEAARQCRTHGSTPCPSRQPSMGIPLELIPFSHPLLITPLVPMRIPAG